MKKGFTLIELLVVVAIIGMLSSVVLSSLNTARASARDARRAQDGKQVAAALELYYSANNGFPANGGTGCSTNYCLSHISAALTPTYIPNLPTDPIYGDSGTYPYRYCVTGNAFELLVYDEGLSSWCHIRHGSNDSGSGCWMTNGVPNSGTVWCD
ncbi:MAG: type II secretion system protein [Patescibacteria group bacterium UBA2103]